MFVVYPINNMVDYYGEYPLNWYDYYEYYEDDFDIKGNYFELSNGSSIYFGNDMIYSLYDDGNNYSGYYEYYEGGDAVRYIMDNYIDEYNNNSLFDRGEYGDYEDFYVIVLEEFDIYEENKPIYVYYGYYDDGVLNMVDILSSEEVKFTLSIGSEVGGNVI